MLYLLRCLKLCIESSFSRDCRRLLVRQAAIEVGKDKARGNSVGRSFGLYLQLGGAAGRTVADVDAEMETQDAERTRLQAARDELLAKIGRARYASSWAMASTLACRLQARKIWCM